MDFRLVITSSRFIKEIAFFWDITLCLSLLLVRITKNGFPILVPFSLLRDQNGKAAALYKIRLFSYRLLLSLIQSLHFARRKQLFSYHDISE